MLLGVCSIFAGAGRAIKGLEFSGAAAFILLIAYACIGVWSLILLRDRSSGGLYVSQWYLLAAFLCFPGFMPRRTCCSSGIRCKDPRKGRLRAGIWEVCFGFGSYRSPWLPSTISFPTSRVARCVLTLERPRFLVPCFSGRMTGTRLLIGGPIPAWMVSASVAASIMMLIPATVICINTLGTFSGRAVSPAPEASFTIFDWFVLPWSSCKGLLLH